MTYKAQRPLPAGECNWLFTLCQKYAILSRYEVENSSNHRPSNMSILRRLLCILLHEQFYTPYWQTDYARHYRCNLCDRRFTRPRRL